MVLNKEKIARQVQHIRQVALIEFGQPFEELSIREKAEIIAIAAREEVLIRQATTQKTYLTEKPKKLYYLSLEYLPGVWSLMNIINILAFDDLKAIAKAMNFSITEIEEAYIDPALGNGGLGRLASCFLDSLATLGMPAIGYGLLYEYGIFKQEIIYGTQIEMAETWLDRRNPWIKFDPKSSARVQYNGELKEARNNSGEISYSLINFDEVNAQCFSIPTVGYGEFGSVNLLKLFSTKAISSNFKIICFSAGDLASATKFTHITSVLYPSDAVELGKEYRLMQEYLLVSGAIQDMFRDFFASYTDISQLRDKVTIQLNDTHPAIACAELIRVLVREYHTTIPLAWEITSNCLNYTNHTILQEALEKWDETLFRRLLPRQMKAIELINQFICDQVRQKFPYNEELIQEISIIQDDKVHMARLCCHVCKKINGVARLHSQLIKETIFKPFYKLYPEKFTNVTNGVTFRRWALKCNPSLAKLLDETIGKGWVTEYEKFKDLRKFANDPKIKNRLLEIKEESKARLIEYLANLRKTREGTDDALWANVFHQNKVVEKGVLFDLQIKRLHEYKRQMMNALHLMLLYKEIKEKSYIPPVKKFSIFAGKSAASYTLMKDLIRLICAISRHVNNDPEVSQHLKCIFVPNYNVSLAEKLIPAADVSMQISTAGFEASGTSLFKFCLNGALLVGTLDGATIELKEEVGEGYFPFLFGATKDEIFDKIHNKSYHPQQLVNENRDIRWLIETLRSDLLASYAEERESFSRIANYLENQDPYFSLYDLAQYHKVQKEALSLYTDKDKWNHLVLMNIAGVGNFSSDRSIRDYSKNIWDLKPVPMDKKILDEMRAIFVANDKCTIDPNIFKDIKD
ncbi:MAG: glycogen/starch/alpha-glucan phosphorylase [Chlamydiae bacterium]|nr:glycogen/starch/alpha-glucan phosphorylase [Chlamydiota bacterium]